MPVYNGELYIAEAIESILSQTFSDFKLLIIDDGSTDKSLEIAKSYRDHRISIVRNHTNLGLIATLNRGLELIDSEFIARMDCDDVAIPERLKLQVEFLDKNPHIGLCGGYYLKLTDKDSILARFPLRHEDILYEMLFDNVFAHNTIMFRTAIIKHFSFRYDPAYRYAEDYELWVRMSQHCLLANIPRILVKYRFHPDNTSNKFRDTQKAVASKIRLIHRRNLGLPSTENDTILHEELRSLSFPKDINRLIMAGAWLSRLFWVAVRRCRQNPFRVAMDYNRMWYSACGRNAEHGLHVFMIYITKPYGLFANPFNTAKLIIRCLIKRPI
jgi:glycosyltransferase involved in cell wall biosynthesis